MNCSIVSDFIRALDTDALPFPPAHSFSRAHPLGSCSCPSSSSCPPPFFPSVHVLFLLFLFGVQLPLTLEYQVLAVDLKPFSFQQAVPSESSHVPCAPSEWSHSLLSRCRMSSCAPKRRTWICTFCHSCTWIASLCHALTGAGPAASCCVSWSLCSEDNSKLLDLQHGSAGVSSNQTSMDTCFRRCSTCRISPWVSLCLFSSEGKPNKVWHCSQTCFFSCSDFSWKSHTSLVMNFFTEGADMLHSERVLCLDVCVECSFALKPDGADFTSHLYLQREEEPWGLSPRYSHTKLLWSVWHGVPLLGWLAHMGLSSFRFMRLLQHIHGKPRILFLRTWCQWLLSELS